MKKLLFLLATIFAFNGQAQDDLSGWYADGIKVDKISCYGFKNLQLVVPYNSEWGSYTSLSIKVIAGGAANSGVKLIDLTSINSFIKGKYLVINLFAQGEVPHGDIFKAPKTNNDDGLPVPQIGVNPYQYSYELRRWELKYDAAGNKEHGKPAPDLKLSFRIFGLKKTGEKEEFEQSCKCLRKTPIYSSEKLTKTYDLICTNREMFSQKKLGQWEKNIFTDACPTEGTKVDFNSLK